MPTWLHELGSGCDAYPNGLSPNPFANVAFHASHELVPSGYFTGEKAHMFLLFLLPMLVLSLLAVAIGTLIPIPFPFPGGGGDGFLPAVTWTAYPRSSMDYWRSSSSRPSQRNGMTSHLFLVTTVSAGRWRHLRQKWRKTTVATSTSALVPLWIHWEFGSFILLLSFLNPPCNCLHRDGDDCSF
jgi:hypothetical protein